MGNEEKNSLIRDEKLAEIIRYVIVGGMTTVVGLGSYWLVTVTFLDPLVPWQLAVANVISWVAAVTFAFVANKLVVFRVRNTNALKEAVKFYAARVGTLLLEMALMYLFVSVLGVNDMLMKLICAVIVTIVNYFLSKLLIFTKKENADA